MSAPAGRAGRAGRFKDYPAPFPACLRRMGFVDQSWHNDAAGRAVLDLPDGKCVVVWCAEKKPSEREFPDWKRFGGYVCKGSSDGEIDDNEQLAAPEMQLEAETPAELETKVKALVAAARGGASAGPRRRRRGR